MSLYDSLGNNRQMNPQQMMQQLRANPSGFLKQYGLNVPAGMNNPQQIVQNLLQSGQVPNARFQHIMQMMNRR